MIRLRQIHQARSKLRGIKPPLGLNQATGIEVSKEILKIDPNARIFILSAFFEKDYILSAVNLGVVGYLLKDVSIDELIASLVASYSGERSFTPQIQDLMNRDAITSV